MEGVAIAQQMFGGFPQALIALMGSALLLLSAGLARRAVRITGGHTAIGTIVRYRRKDDAESSTAYSPIFRFRPGACEEIEVQSQTGARTKPGPVGEIVTVHYDPDHPRRADISSPARQWLAVGGVAFLACGTLYSAWKIGGY